jgi:hypothetical protein
VSPVGLDAIEVGHARVHHAQFRLRLFSLFDRLATVGHLGDDTEIRLSREDHAETPAHNRRFISQENSRHGAINR